MALSKAEKERREIIEQLQDYTLYVSKIGFRFPAVFDDAQATQRLLVDLARRIREVGAKHPSMWEEKVSETEAAT